MGAPQGLHPSVQIPAHRALFAGGLGVEVHQHDIGLSFSEKMVRHGKGIIKIAVHLAPADEIHYAHPEPSGPLENAPAPAGDPARIVGRPEDIRIFVQIIGDLQPVPGVVAQGDDVGPSIKNGVGLPGVDAYPRGVFAVDYSKMDVIGLFQAPQMAG